MSHRKPAFLNNPESLPDAEKELLAACAEGRSCRLGTVRPDPNDLSAPTIRAELIRFLALGGDDDHPVDPYGIALRGARIEGVLNLEFCRNLRPLMLFVCSVLEPVILLGATLPLLNLSGSRLCETGENGISLIADGVQVTGSVFLRAGFEAPGCVRLGGAELGGDLSCSGGKFGAANFALVADRVKVQGGVFLNDRFEAHGTVRLVGADLGGELNCVGGTFLAPHDALNLYGAHVNGSFHFWNLSERPAGAVYLADAHVGTLVDDVDSWPAPGNLFLEGFTYDRFGGNAPTEFIKRKQWIGLQPQTHLTIDFRPQPWVQLAKVLNEMGHIDDARRIAMEKQRRLRRSLRARALRDFPKLWTERREAIDRQEIDRLDQELRNAWLARFTSRPRVGLSWLYEALIGFGYRPGRALGWSLLFVVLGIFIFDGAKRADLMVPNQPKVIETAWKQAIEAQEDDGESVYTAFAKAAPDYEDFESLPYAIDSFVPLVNLHQEENWIPRSGTFARYYLYLHIAMGWILTTLIVASLTGIVKKD